MSHRNRLPRPAAASPAAKPASRLPLALLLLGLACAAAAALVAGRDWAAERRLVLADPDGILARPNLAVYALSQGRTVFAAHCASCHGQAGRGDPSAGIPDLTDRDYLYGEGRVSDIEDIVRHGIRAGDRRGRNFAFMPAYASPRPYAAEPIPPVTPPELRDVVQAVLDFTGRATDAASAARGRALFAGKAGCYDCHGNDAKGDPAIGAPNLTDRIWLYGDGSAHAIADSIARGRKGYSPAYKDILTSGQTRAVAVYAASLSRPAAQQHAER